MTLCVPTRKIGNTEVNGIGLGLMGLSAFYGPVPNDEERFKVLDAAFDAGCRTWDSADVYGNSEELVGKWFKRTGKRDQVFLATKFDLTPSGLNNDPVYMRARVENSLKRSLIGAFFAREGKVRYIDLSEVTGAALRRAHAIHPIAAVQVEYSPFCLDIEDENIELKKACEEPGITIVAYAPLGNSHQKSNADFSEDDFRKRVPNNDNFPRILSLVGCLKQIGEKYNATSGQVSLAWIMAQGPNIIPIPGTKKIEYLKENLESVNVKLTPAEVAEIRAAADKFRATEKFPPSFLSGLLVDTVPLE